jgi:hypothetical protein
MSTAEADEGATSAATSASDGQYAVAGLFAGKFRARADAEGYARLRGEVIVDEQEPVVKRDFLMEPECRLRVDVVDRGGNAVPMRAVKVMPNDSRALSDEYDATRVDNDGFTLVRGVGTGNYNLAIEAPGLFAHESTIACVAGEKRDVRVALRRFATLSVIARDALGAPLKNAAFRIVDLETGDDVTAWIAVGRVALAAESLATDDKGALRLVGLPEGRYRVVGYGIDAEVDTAFDADAKPITLSAPR